MQCRFTENFIKLTTLATAIFIALQASASFAATNQKRFSVRSNLMNLNTGFNLEANVATSRYLLGVSYSNFSGERKYGLFAQTNEMQEYGLRVDVFFAPKALQSAFYVAAVVAHQKGSQLTKDAQTKNGEACFLEVRSEGSQMLTRAVFGYAWVTNVGLTANLGAGVEMAWARPSAKIETSSINCSFPVNDSELQHKKVQPLAELSIGWAL